MGDELGRRQQFANQSSTPISIVAAMMPNAIAPRRLGLLRLMRSTPGFVARSWVLVLSVFALSACRETTAPALRYPVLDDVGLADWASVTVGADHTCGLTSSGHAYCWGSNQFGQLGFSVVDTLCGAQSARYACSLSPRSIQADLKFSTISAGAHHTCAITTSRDAYCWGANESGQTGDVGVANPTPMKIIGGLPWSQISAGFSHTCAIRTDGALFCWGGNDRGQLGNGTLIGGSNLVRVNLPGPVAMVSAGQSRTCARTTSGTVYCWGAVWISRENGLEMTRAQTTPALVPSSPSMSSLTVGTFTTCGTDVSGFAYCWEANPRGGLGNGTLDGSTSPERVSTDLEFLQLSAGIAQTCGISITGAGYCWGDDSFGQLGVSPSALIERCASGTLPCSTRPVEVVGRQQFTQLATGLGSHTCGVTTVGNLYCWGLGVSGQRGDGSATSATFTPVLVADRK
jgi:alpha-tubulin suppressor-like RCC1 family protein